MQKSETVVRNRSVTAEEAILGLHTLQGQLTKTHLKDRAQAFAKAEKWIRDVAEAGGVGPGTTRIFANKGVNPRDARVDIEVRRGRINLTKK